MISIIVPFNKGEKYLNDCLENLSKIKYNDFEVILIDDFSEDNSEKIAKKYSNKLKLKYYYTSEKTIGVGNARNLGIEKANGKYIIFLDVDDIIDENLLNDLQKYVDQGIELIKYKMKIIINNEVYFADGPIFSAVDGQEGFNKLCFKDEFLDSPCLYLIKKDLFKRSNLRFEKNVYHEDFGLIPLLLVNAKSIASTEYYGYNYFQTDESIMRNSDYSRKLKKVNDKFNLYDILTEKIKEYKLSNETEQNLLEYYTNSIIIAIKDLDLEDRKLFEKRIKKRELIKNIKVRNFRQLIKKLVLKLNIDLYLIYYKR